MFIRPRSECACPCHRQSCMDDAECDSQRVFGKLITCCYEPVPPGNYLEQEELQRIYLPDVWLHYVETGQDLTARTNDAAHPIWGYDLAEYRKLRAVVDRKLGRGDRRPNPWYS